MTEEEVYRYIMLSYETEVTNRYFTLKKSQELEDIVLTIAQWLTNEKSSFGLLLCGGLGNGKTTLMKALQRLIRNFRIVDEFNETYNLHIMNSTSILELSKEEKKL